MTRRHLIAAIICVLAAAGIFAATTDDSVPDSKYLRYAEGFAPYTAKLEAVKDNKPSEATATLISEHWALTAAHVVEGADKVFVQLGTKAWLADRVVRHPEYDPQMPLRNDLALVHVSAGFGLDFYPPLSTGGEAEGDAVSIVGYGLHGRMSAGYDTHDGKLRAGTNKIERLEGSLIVCTASPGRSPLEICISPGDSGGPLFWNGKLAGVNSITMAAKGPLKSRAGEESGHVRVALYREWIEEVTR